MRCALCVSDGTHQDEVSGTWFCAEHAGPLRWSDHDLDAYSLALKLAGMHDAPLPLPRLSCEAVSTQHSSSAGDANIPLERDAQGVTAEQFMSELFEFELCSECGGDRGAHVAGLGPLGNWHAWCSKERAA